MAASPRLEKPASQIQEPSFSAADSRYVAELSRSLSSHHQFGYSSFSWSARARALVSTPALAAARSSYRPAAKAHERIAELLPLHSRAIRAIVVESPSKARALAQPHVNERRRRRYRPHGHDIPI